MKSFRFTFLALLFAVQVFSQNSTLKEITYESDDPKGLSDVPVVFRLVQNYPNPYNPVTNIKFTLLVPADYTFSVFDVAGNEIYKIKDAGKAGTYNIKFDGSDLSSGIYFYRLQANGFVDTRKMILVK